MCLVVQSHSTPCKEQIATSSARVPAVFWWTPERELMALSTICWYVARGLRRELDHLEIIITFLFVRWVGFKYIFDKYFKLVCDLFPWVVLVHESYKTGVGKYWCNLSRNSSFQQIRSCCVCWLIAAYQDVMREVGCQTLDAILLTHWHADHTGGVNDVLNALGGNIPVFKWVSHKRSRSYQMTTPMHPRLLPELPLHARDVPDSSTGCQRRALKLGPAAQAL